MRITPRVGVAGLYEVRMPWQLQVDAIYECIADRAMVDLIDRGTDILKLVYEPVGLGESQYADDVNEGASIISLMSRTDSSAPVIHIPDTYIVSYPNMDISNYNRIIVSIDLGALPINTDVTSMLLYLKEATKDVIGVESEPNVHRGPASGSITFAQHEELLRKRNAFKKKNLSLHVEKELLEKENMELRRQLDEAIRQLRRQETRS
jgi:hypothetical protein